MMILIIIVLTIYANIRIENNYNKYSKINNKNNITGKEVAEKILIANNLTNIKVYEVNGHLTDHYNPNKQTINLSKDIYSKSTIASAAVAAHEVGHAIQNKENYKYYVLRTKLVPIVNLTSRIASILLFISFILELYNLINFAIIMLLFSLLFQLVTLPVEFDASKRGKEELIKLSIINNDEAHGVTKVLKAAAFTYVASFISTALQILRLFLNTRKDD